MKRAVVAAALFAVALAAGAEMAFVAPFSAMTPGGPLLPWREVVLRNVKPPRYALVADAGTTVLEVRSEAAVGSVSHEIPADAATRPLLSWRWKVDRVVETADLETRAADDFAARLYVFFDVPLEDLSFLQRAKIRIARALYGPQVPTAAICYVWDNRHAAGTIAPSAYTERVRLWVLESGSGQAMRWVTESRDVEADFRKAFARPEGSPVPRVTGVAVGADTDQTGESVTAWFGDVRLEARR